MKRISLTPSGATLVDDEDYEKFKHLHFCLDKKGYALTKADRKTTRLHRLVMSAKPGELVDHINGDNLDNRKENLRIVNHAQNAWNHKLKTTNTTGYKGVSKNRHRFIARIFKNGQYVGLGTYDTPQEAHKVYLKASKQYFGEYSRAD